MEIGSRARGDGGNGLTAFARARINFVVHIRDVARVSDARIKPTQQPRQNIKHHHRARIAQMREVINRGAADIELHMLGIERFKAPFGTRRTVMEKNIGHALAARRNLQARRGFISPNERQHGADIRPMFFTRQRQTHGQK